MKTRIFFILALCGCAREPVTNWGIRDGGIDSGPNSGNDTDSNSDDQDSVTDTDTGPDTSTSSDIDSETNKDTDTATDVDTNTETGSEIHNETDTGDTGDTETGSDTENDSDTLPNCPWKCEPNDGTGLAYICDNDPTNPTTIQNWNFACSSGGVCCQPLSADDPGAIKKYCPDYGYECIEPAFCPEGKSHKEYYCNASMRYCCG